MLRVAIGGSTGFIGRAVSSLLREHGHVIRPLLRPSSAPIENGIRWNPAGGTIDEAELEQVDAIINLAGESIGAKRWTEKQKKMMTSSRVQSTKVLAGAIASLSRKPNVFVNASASGYYGDGGDDSLTEDSPNGSGFLANLCKQWEDAARSNGVRNVFIRSGLVMGASGGLLRTMLPPFKLGAGATLGGGSQWMPWISIRDEARAIVSLLEDDSATGAFNLCAPEPVRNKEFTKSLGKALRRPAVLSIPAFALKAAFGSQATEEAFLVSQRMLPARLLSSGFTFNDSSLASSWNSILSG